MLKNLMHSYQSAKLAVIKKFSDQNYDILDEPGFLDDGFIRTKIQLIKQEYTKIEKEVELLQYDQKDEYHQQKLSYLSDYKDDLLLQLAFLSSNSLNSVENALSLLDGVSTDFQLCLQALLKYKNSDETKAALLFKQYFQLHSEPLDHFLINMVFGELLCKQNNLETGLMHLRKAAEKRPEDLQTHQLLHQAYRKTGNGDQLRAQEQIIELLGGGDYLNS